VRTLYLIKHGAPEIRPGVSAHDWPLSEAGRVQALALAKQLATRALDVIVTSEDAKAVETGRVIAKALQLPLRRGLGLHEQPGLHTTIVGTRNPEHLRANIRAAIQGPLPPEVVNKAKRRLAEAGAVSHAVAS
jgi:broad specificity phosphatase PhoE